MTDIVERLREYSKDWRDRASDASVAVDAADTITALRSSLNEIREENDRLKGETASEKYIQTSDRPTATP